MVFPACLSVCVLASADHLFLEAVDRRSPIYFSVGRPKLYILHVCTHGAISYHVSPLHFSVVTVVYFPQHDWNRPTLTAAVITHQHQYPRLAAGLNRRLPDCLSVNIRQSSGSFCWLGHDALLYLPRNCLYCMSSDLFLNVTHQQQQQYMLTRISDIIAIYSHNFCCVSLWIIAHKTSQPA